MNRLVLLTNSFPYGPWEPYLETELPHLEVFDRIDIIALSVRADHRATYREPPSQKFHVHAQPFRPAWRYLANLPRVLASHDLWSELVRLARTRQFTLRRLAWLLAFLSRSDLEFRQMVRDLAGAGLDADDTGVIYSYRLEYTAYLAGRLRDLHPRFAAVARGHGYDIHPSRHRTGYIPLRDRTFTALDEIGIVSQSGLDYLVGEYPHHSDRLALRRLGTQDHGIAADPGPRNPLTVLSCAVVGPHKRVLSLVRALGAITDLTIHWIHYGDGPQLDEVTAAAAELPANVHADLRGHVPNAEVLRSLAEDGVHAFVSLSETEGVPVSMMEAISFGIPVIATNAGGTREIVKDDVTGTLLPLDVTDDDVVRALQSLAGMDDASYLALRRRARAHWEQHWSSAAAYDAFAEHLINLASRRAER